MPHQRSISAIVLASALAAHGCGELICDTSCEGGRTEVQGSEAMFSRGGAAGTGFTVAAPRACADGGGDVVAVTGSGWKRAGIPVEGGACTLIGGGEAARCDVTIEELRAELRRRLGDAHLDAATVGFGLVCRQEAVSGVFVQIDDWAAADATVDAIGLALYRLNLGDTVHLLVAGLEISCPMIGCGI